MTRAQEIERCARDLIALIDNDHNRGLSGFYLQRERFVAMRAALALPPVAVEAVAKYANPGEWCASCGSRRRAAKHSTTVFDPACQSRVTVFDSEPFDFSGYAQSKECPDAWHLAPVEPTR